MTTPPLLLLAAGRRPRLRRAPKLLPKEIELHMAVADLLRQFARPDWRWGHYPAGEHRDIRVAAKLKAMGAQRGWADFLLFSPAGQLHALELKRGGEKLTNEQEDFAAWCAASQVPHRVVRTLEEAVRFLGECGVWRVKICGVGRDTLISPVWRRSKSERIGKFSDALLAEGYAP